jgi:hypothetical protein
MVKWYWYLIAVVIACMLFAGGQFAGSRYPIPIVDKGHRFYGVVDEDAQKAIVTILKRNGIGPWRTFEVGITNQVIMSDKETVIGRFSEDVKDLPKHVISVPVNNPAVAADEACLVLRSFNYTATVHKPLGDDIPFVLIKTNAFLDSGGIAFRLPITKMPKPKWVENPD